MLNTDLAGSFGLDMFRRQEVELPAVWSYATFEESFADVIDRLDALLDRFTSNEAVFSGLAAHVDERRQLREKLRESVECYLAGSPAKSYDAFLAGMTVIHDYINPFKSDIQPCDPSGAFYRIRTCSMPLSRSCDMFHIPYQLRHNVRSQRYSIPGLPCLYLGGSVWTCWEEMGRPSFSQSYVSKFNLVQSCTVLDLGMTPFAFKHDTLQSCDCIDTAVARCVAYGCVWPLVAACSVSVKHRGFPFSPEHIIPQHLLRWVVDKGWDGIRYFSTRTLPRSPNYKGTSNLVFPATTKLSSGHCRKLMAKFTVTKPLPFDILTRIKFPPHRVVN